MADKISYRRAGERDLHALARVQSESARWQAERSGRDVSAIPRRLEPSPGRRHLLRTDPDLLWLATAGGRPVGFSAGAVRDGLWLLSALFVRPRHHGRGIGKELLRRCQVAARARGATTDAVVASSDASAQSLYVRAGLVARFPIFVVEGPVEGLISLALPKGRVASVERPAPAAIRRLNALDDAVAGWQREIDHRFWLHQPAYACRVVEGEAGDLGYVYYQPDFIGPLAATTPRGQLQLLRLAGEAQHEAQASASVRLHVPGANQTVLRALLERGFRIDHANLFMSSRPLGHFDRYVPSGGGLL